MKQIAQGAEAKLYSDGIDVVKHRFEKNYRHMEIDSALRKFRTRREFKVLKKLNELEFPSPRARESDDKKMTIAMEHIPGPLLKEILHLDHKKLGREIGKKVARLHSNNIIHGDLTTSNMIFNDEIHFIDFGLSFFSEKAEDKAVDLHLLKQALESKHYKIFDQCFNEVLKGYKDYSKHKEVLKRLEVVEKRGKNKH